MGFLNPVFLLGGIAVAIPLLLHLLHRSEQRRVAFPALRYLLKTEKEHARRIRMRQWLLLALRCLVLLLLTLAAAQTVLRGGGSAHPPTAIAIVLDNSLSSQRVVGAGRVLDSLKARALDVVDQAGEADLIWVLRAGEPWDVAPPQNALDARTRILGTTPTAARGELSSVLRRADRLLREAPLEEREIHLLSDLQRSAFSDEALNHDAPVLVWTGLGAAGPNRYVRSVVVGGGLAPRVNRRTEFAVTVGASTDDTLQAPVRLFLTGQLRGAADARAQSTVLLPAGPFPEGRLTGYAETDPDALRADDRRWIVVGVEPPPGVAILGDAGPFVREAFAVLEESGRIQQVAPSQADVLVSVAAEGLGARSAGQRVVVLPHPDPALRTATNQRLADAGVPLGLGARSAGLRTGEDNSTVGLDSIRLDLAWTVEGDGDVRIRRTDGAPWWMVAALTDGSVALLGSPFTLDATSLPLEAAMLPFLEELISGGGIQAGSGFEAGDAIPLPRAATEVEGPDGRRYAIDASHQFPFTADVGIYSILTDGEVVGQIAVNPPLAESRLDPIGEAELRARLTGRLVTLESAQDWSRGVLLSRRGQELWKALLVLTLLLLIAESWVAASGGGKSTAATRNNQQARANS